WNAALYYQHAGPGRARPERDREVLGVPGRRIDRLLKIESPMDMAQEELRRPLVLLVAAGRAPREIRLAVTQRQGGRQRGARPFAGLERSRMVFLQPEHLPPGAEAESEFRNHRRGLQPAAGGRRGNHVAGPIDDVEMHGIAAHFTEPADRRL